MPQRGVTLHDPISTLRNPRGGWGRGGAGGLQAGADGEEAKAEEGFGALSSSISGTPPLKTQVATVGLGQLHRGVVGGLGKAGKRGLGGVRDCWGAAEWGAQRSAQLQAHSRPLGPFSGLQQGGGEGSAEGTGRSEGVGEGEGGGGEQRQQSSLLGEEVWEDAIGSYRDLQLLNGPASAPRLGKPVGLIAAVGMKRVAVSDGNLERSASGHGLGREGVSRGEDGSQGGEGAGVGGRQGAGGRLQAMAVESTMASIRDHLPSPRLSPAASLDNPHPTLTHDVLVEAAGGVLGMTAGGSAMAEGVTSNNTTARLDPPLSVQGRLVLTGAPGPLSTHPKVQVATASDNGGATSSPFSSPTPASVDLQPAGTPSNSPGAAVGPNPAASQAFSTVPQPSPMLVVSSPMPPVSSPMLSLPFAPLQRGGAVLPPHTEPMQQLGRPPNPPPQGSSLMGGQPMCPSPSSPPLHSSNSPIGGQAMRPFPTSPPPNSLESPNRGWPPSSSSDSFTNGSWGVPWSHFFSPMSLSWRGSSPSRPSTPPALPHAPPTALRHTHSNPRPAPGSHPISNMWASGGRPRGARGLGAWEGRQGEAGRATIQSMARASSRAHEQREGGLRCIGPDPRMVASMDNGLGTGKRTTAQAEPEPYKWVDSMSLLEPFPSESQMKVSEHMHECWIS